MCLKLSMHNDNQEGKATLDSKVTTCCFFFFGLLFLRGFRASELELILPLLPVSESAGLPFLKADRSMLSDVLLEVDISRKDDFLLVDPPNRDFLFTE